MKHSLILIVAFLTFFSAQAESPLQRGYLARMDSIDSAISDQEWAKAENLIISTLRYDPSNASNWMLISNLGMIQFYQGKDSLALATLDYGVDIRPGSVTMLTNRARVRQACGMLTGAYQDYSRVLEIDSADVNARYSRALLDIYSGKIEAAQRDIEYLDRYSPEDPLTWEAAATLYTILDHPTEAMVYYNKLIKAKPTAQLYAARAFCLLQLDLLADAAEDIASGLELNDKYSELYLCRAILNKKRYENDRALNDAQRAIDYGTDPNRVKAILGI